MQEFESLGSGQFEIGTSEHFSGCSCADNGGELIFVCETGNHSSGAVSVFVDQNDCVAVKWLGAKAL
jgi:hypothetical protein